LAKIRGLTLVCPFFFCCCGGREGVVPGSGVGSGGVSVSPPWELGCVPVFFSHAPRNVSPPGVGFKVFCSFGDVFFLGRHRLFELGVVVVGGFGAEGLCFCASKFLSPRLIFWLAGCAM